MLNVDLMRVKPLRGPLKRDDAKELQKALKEAGVKNATYWNFDSQIMYFINPKNLIVVDFYLHHHDYISFEDLFVENYEDCRFESELMALLGG